MRKKITFLFLALILWINPSTGTPINEQVTVRNKLLLLEGKIEEVVTTVESTVTLLDNTFEFPTTEEKANVKYVIYPYNVSGSFDTNTNEIALSFVGRFVKLAAVHEIYHFIEIKSLNKNRKLYGLDKVDNVIKKSQLYKDLAKLGKDNGDKILGVRYLLNREELSARAFTQYVTMKSKDKVLLAELNEYRNVSNTGHWTDKDFEPIYKVIDEVYKENKWIK